MSGTIGHVDAELLHARLVGALRAHRLSDGGFPVGADGASEVEPTAVATLALRDERARAWLARRQRPDGGFDEPDGRADGPTSPALAALALAERDAASRALAYAIAHRGVQPPGSPDPERVGWGWTGDARSTVEPTSRVLAAVDALTPSDRAVREEAIGLLRERQCADGGWNYGNASVNDVELRSYAQTTAIALVALQRGPADLVAPALSLLRERWRHEPGGLTTAQALVAFRLHDVEDERAPIVETLAAMSGDASFGARPLTLAWAALATGPDDLLDPLRSRA
jgi:hypothetical protein